MHIMCDIGRIVSSIGVEFMTIRQDIVRDCKGYLGIYRAVLVYLA
jgi:hypothetical protein